MTGDVGHRDSLRSCYRHARAQTAPGGLVTNYVCNPAASVVAAVAIQRRWHPSLVSLGNPVAAAVATVPIAAYSSDAQSGWFPGVLALGLWPLAYILDCVDGQVARAAGKKSEHGGRVDVLADYLAQLLVVAGLVSVLAAKTSIPAAVLSAISGLWFFGTVAATLRKSDISDGHSLLKGHPALGQVLKLVADTGFVNLVAGGWILVSPTTLWVPVAVFSITNLAYLTGSLFREFCLSLTAATRLR